MADRGGGHPRGHAGAADPPELLHARPSRSRRPPQAPLRATRPEPPTPASSSARDPAGAADPVQSLPRGVVDPAST